MTDAPRIVASAPTAGVKSFVSSTTAFSSRCGAFILPRSSPTLSHALSAHSSGNLNHQVSKLLEQPMMKSRNLQLPHGFDHNLREYWGPAGAVRFHRRGSHISTSSYLVCRAIVAKHCCWSLPVSEIQPAREPCRKSGKRAADH
jgi:hypothetical protein